MNIERLKERMEEYRGKLYCGLKRLWKRIYLTL